MNSRATIDVSRLPANALDHRSPIWWGNFLLLLIETTMFALLIATYFYLRQNFRQWPPPRADGFRLMLHPLPSLGVSTLNLIIIVASFLPMFWVDRACLKRNVLAIRIGLLICILLGIVAIIVRFLEFRALHFRWDENAYAATVWTILGMHLAHLITATVENGIMTAWVFAKGLDDKHARDIRVTAVYWYWVIGIWILLYGIVFVGPRLF
jgi:cytochrome c oxidase subunit 3